MKVIIPVAGAGMRLRPHTHTQPKTLVPIAGKPILVHIIDDLLQYGFKDFVFVLGYMGEKVEDFIKTYYQNRINAEFVNQEPREGSAHALWVARQTFANEKDMLIVLGDTIAILDYKALLKSKNSMVAIKKVSNPMLFGIVQLGKKNEVLSLVEKPKIPKSNLALVGVYKITNIPLFLEGINFIMQKNKKTQNEYYLTDALMYMVDKEETIQTLHVEHWYDCGKRETLLEANAILLNKDEFKEQIYTYQDTIIIPPVSIGKNCQIRKSIIGPNVAIGEDTILESTIVTNSIIGSYSELENVVLRDSIVGNDSSLKGESYILSIGDNAEINL
ncbi:MAG: sugar phosphate nucleotidyltransferase [Thermonemataceae bacterium]|nr:sugar phosphate nucleotidyltransferase [Thermonemataceae bacterium]